jgi:hypothetical protein
MSKIDVFIIGAQKAGTTSIYDWLGQHPEIDAPEHIKDYHFFTDKALFKKGIEHLEEQYKLHNKLKIHCAVNYLYFSKIVSERIHSYNPEAKIIVCLREPVARAISAYKYFIRTLRENNDFSESLRLEKQDKLKSFAEKADNAYISHGNYAEQISDYIQYFPNSKIHYIVFEELIDSDKQANIMSDLCEFLGVRRDFVFNFTHLNASGQPRSKILNYLIRRPALTRVFRYLIPLRPRKIIVKKIEEKNTSFNNIQVKINQEDYLYLKKYYSVQNKKLYGIINRNLDGIWK